MRPLVVLVAFAVAFSGCTKDTSDVVDTPQGASGSDGVAGDGRADPLGGWVFNPALAPIVGAVVEIPGENLTAKTGKDGYYGFVGLPTDRVLVVVAKADGFQPLSKTITLKPESLHRMNFSLDPVPVKTPRVERQSVAGFIGCSALVRTESTRYPYDCSAASPVDERIWEFNVQGDVAGIIIEASWEPDSPLADHLNMTVETVNLGIFDEILCQNEGPAILRCQVTKDQSERFYRQGGTLRVTVDIGRNIEDEEAGAGAAVAIQQSYEVIASIFYVAPPPPGYTVAA